MYFSVKFSCFTFLGRFWSSWIWMSISLHGVEEKYSAIISLNKLFGPFFLFSPSGIPTVYMLACLANLFHKSLMLSTLLHFFFSFFVPLNELFSMTYPLIH